MRIIPQEATILTGLDDMDVSRRIELCGRICYKSEGRTTIYSHLSFLRKVLANGHNSVLEMATISLRVVIDDCSKLVDFMMLEIKYLVIDEMEDGTLLITGSIRAFRDLKSLFPENPVVQSILCYLNLRYPLLFDDHGADISDDIMLSKMPLAAIERLSPDLVCRHRFVAVKLITNRAVTHEIVRYRPCSFLQESQRYCRYDKDQFGGEVTFIKPVFYSVGTPEYDLWLYAMEKTEKTYLRLLATSSPQAARTVLPNSCKTEIIVYANLVEWHHIFNLRTSPAADPSMRALMIPLMDKFVTRWHQCFLSGVNRSESVISIRGMS
jgi:thymidylate synthase (FAD)